MEEGNMPQPRILDFGEDPLAGAFRGFGTAFGNQTVENSQQDALNQILQSIREGDSEEDVLKKLIGARNVPTEKGFKAFDAISKVRQNVKKANEERVAEEKKIATKDKLIKAGLPENLANLYADATVGGQTEIIKYLRQQAEWNPEAKDYLGKLLDTNETPEAKPYSPAATGDITPQSNVPLPEIEEGVEPVGPPPVSIEDDSKLPPAKLFDRQESRFKVQTPLLNTLSDQIKFAETEGNTTNNLIDLNDRGDLEPDVFSRLNRNPFTGDIIFPAFASPQEQLFQKTVNDFISRAKDFFGARVTNFDLERFMARLPTLGNTPEGRRAILKEMQLANELMLLEKKAIQQVFDERGVRNIDWSDAEKIARKRTEKDKSRIEKEIRSVNTILDKEKNEMIKQFKQNVPKGHTLMMKPNGKYAYFPNKNIKSLQEKGYERL